MPGAANASTVNVPIPDCTRVSVTVGDCGVRIVETSRVVRGSSHREAGRVVAGPG